MVESALTSLLPATTHAPEETVELGRRIAGAFSPGSVVAVYGDLGAGKTQLIKGICDGLGVPAGQVHSPTFTIVNEYATARVPVYHFDAYRVTRLEEFFDLGYEDYFYGPGLCLVEWADRVEPLLPGDAVRIALRHVADDVRHVMLRGTAPDA